MKSQYTKLVSLVLVLFLSGVWIFDSAAQLPEEQPLWPSGKYEHELPSYSGFNQVKTGPDFVGLFYPGLNADLINLAGKKDNVPPVFIMNGGEHKTTPAGNCIELFKVLTSKNFNAELHIYAKGGHGFDSGLERGYAISTWRDSFIAWLKDTGFIKE